MFSSLSRRSRSILVAAAALALVTGAADARPAGGSSSFGSRGSRTYSAPPPTATAPSTARPMERSYTQPGPSGVPGMNAAPQRRFGFGTGLFAGLLGAGVLGMLFGHGFLGGLAGLASMFGFLIQLALIAGLAYVAIRWFRGRAQPAVAGGAYARTAMGGGGMGGPMPGASPVGGAGATAPRDSIGIGPADYKAFEQTLTEIQLAYGREDQAALRALTTPEMASYFAQELAGNASRGVVNRIADVRLLQGDLAEAWREGPTDYASVAVRFQLVDTTVDRASGRVVQGDPARPTEAVEVWTFRRDGGARWILSAIQQSR